MNKKEYKEYESSVAEFFTREGVNYVSAIDSQAGQYFSHNPCDVCDKRLGGDREDCSGYNPTTKKIQGPYSVCSDCTYYIEYGQLDDMTMLDMED